MHRAWQEPRRRVYRAGLIDNDTPLTVHFSELLEEGDDAVYLLADGVTQIAHGFQELVGAMGMVGRPMKPIIMTEDGMTPPDTFCTNCVWSNIDSAGNLATSDCMQYTSDSDDVFGAIGLAAPPNPDDPLWEEYWWTDSGQKIPCDLEAHLYCVQIEVQG